MSDIGDLYQDAMAGAIYAAIAWIRHPLVCPSLPKEIVDLIELETDARNDAIEALKKENEALKKRERDRWENVNETFGTAYLTERANKWMNLPMNVDDFGTRRPGDF